MARTLGPGAPYRGFLADRLFGPLGMASATTNHPFYCGTSAYDHTYAAIYQFPTGTYWQAEIAAGYYKATNTKLLAQYGC